MQIQRTPHGFDCRAATTLRTAPLADGPRAMLTPRITKSGKMRVYNAKDSTNKKEML